MPYQVFFVYLEFLKMTQREFKHNCVVADHTIAVADIGIRALRPEHPTLLTRDVACFP